MAETVSPEATVWLPPVVTGAAVCTAVLVVGMVSRWPSRMNARESSPFALRTADTDVPYFVAMWLTVSPDRTVYCSSAWATPAEAVAATAAIAIAPVPVASRRAALVPRARDATSGSRAAWSVRARAGCVMVRTPVLSTWWCVDVT